MISLLIFRFSNFTLPISSRNSSLWSSSRCVNTLIFLFFETFADICIPEPEDDGFILFPFEVCGADVDAADDAELVVVTVTVDGAGVSVVAEIVALEHATVAAVAVGIVSTAVESVGDAVVAVVSVVFCGVPVAFDVLSAVSEKKNKKKQR